MGVKQKTKRAAQKRFRKTASGKILRRHAFIGHLARKKSPKQRRQARGPKTMTKGDANRYRDFIN